jgi:hypothetical protein
VRQSLREVVNELGKSYGELDGLVLRCCLPSDVLLGFNPEACAAYRRIRGMDPKNLLVESARDTPDASNWTDWRCELATSLIRELAAAFTAKVFSAKVAVVGKAGWHRMSWQRRNFSLENWPRWIAGGWFDEVLLECEWDHARIEDDLASCDPLFSDSVQPVRSTVVLPLAQDTMDRARKGAFAALRGSPLRSLVFKPEKDGDVLAGSRVRDTGRQKPKAAEAPSGKRSSLQDDPRLQVPLKVNLKQPSVRDCLRVLNEATQLEFTASRAIEEQGGTLGSLSFFNTPAWRVMELVAEEMTVEGRWEPSENGYHLLGRPKLQPAGQPSPSFLRRFAFPLWLTAGPLGFLLVVRMVRHFRVRSKLRSQQAQPTLRHDP